MGNVLICMRRLLGIESYADEQKALQEVKAKYAYIPGIQNSTSMEQAMQLIGPDMAKDVLLDRMAKQSKLQRDLTDDSKDQTDAIKEEQLAQSEAINAMEAVNSLLSNEDGIQEITGVFQGWFGNVRPGGPGALAENQYDQLMGILSLENRRKLKGQGTISDFEAKMLSDAASSLGRNLGEADFKRELKKIRGVFTNAAGLEASIIVTSPSGESIRTTASREEINSLIAEGNKINYN